MRMTERFLNWRKCTGRPSEWCSLLDLNLNHRHFEGLKGVYVIWHGGARPIAVRVGQGVIRDRLRAHQSNLAVLAYASYGLFVTWAAVPKQDRDGVERYLAEYLQPLFGARYPSATPISVNLPGE